MFRMLIAIATIALSTPCWAQSTVRVKFDTGTGTRSQEIDAMLTIPETGGTGEALLILHHAGGYSYNTTWQYAEFFSKRGFTTLELKMFNDHTARPDPLTLHGQVMGGLKYLATLKNVNRQKISVMGMSLGAMLTIHAGSTWFYDTFQAEDLRFNKLVALYPVCWIMSEVSKGQMQGLPSYAGLPSTFLQKWVGAPLLILAAGKDSYDGSNPDACPTFVRGIADVQQSKMTTVEVYKHATHGWDHGKSYSFPIRGGCVGRSDCTNHITYNREIVEAGKQAALSFLNDQ